MNTFRLFADQLEAPFAALLDPLTNELLFTFFDDSIGALGDYVLVSVSTNDGTNSVPEPDVLGLVGVGLLAQTTLRRRRRAPLPG